MLSRSNLTIAWVKPVLDEEQWEFFQHPAKQPFYRRHGLDWERLGAAFEDGVLTPWDRGDRLEGVPVDLAYASYDDYLKYLAKAKRGYRINYSRLENELQRHGTLTLKAPIVLRCAGEALLFSGYRRLCLAWNYGMVPAVWLVTLPAAPLGDSAGPEPEHPDHPCAAETDGAGAGGSARSGPRAMRPTPAT